MTRKKIRQTNSWAVRETEKEAKKGRFTPYTKTTFPGTKFFSVGVNPKSTIRGCDAHKELIILATQICEKSITTSLRSSWWPHVK